MPTTYEPIATTTLGSAATEIVFSSIPATYTDLRLIVTGTHSVTTYLRFRFNGDTATNYSVVQLYGNGSGSASAGVLNSVTSLATGANVQQSTTIPYFISLDLFSYAGSNNKTSLCLVSNDLNGTGETAAVTGLYRSTVAITSLTIFPFSGNLNAGTIATLYGIQAA
jgi:hypothetical protein